MAIQQEQSKQPLIIMETLKTHTMTKYGKVKE